MNYQLIKDIISLTETFEQENISNAYSYNIDGFKEWIKNEQNPKAGTTLSYVGLDTGRTLDSVISTLLVHLGRYAKSYSKAAMMDSIFATQDEFIFLITLKSFGAMSKMDLIKKNVHEKPGGMQIISRLLKHDLITQKKDDFDKRSKLISISEKGLQVLDQHMTSIRKATTIVAGNLSTAEKVNLVQLLTKLENFHLDIYDQNILTKNLLEFGLNQINHE